jgi:hypothetical protein
MGILRSLVLLALVTTPGALLAQSNPVSNAVRNVAHDSGKNLLTAAQAMPADKFGYKPTPAQMTFGDAEGALKPIDRKEDLVAALQRSLAFCDAALDRVTDAQLGDLVPYYGHRAQRAAAMIGLVTDWANHYSQQAIYLRLNEVLPPTARRN